MLPDTPLPSVTAADALRLVADGATLLDVREDGEWAAGHSAAAEHAPMSRLSTTPLHLAPGAPVIVVCRSGNRSQPVTRALRQHGVEAFNLTGGMQAWRSAGGDVVTDSGVPGFVA